MIKSKTIKITYTGRPSFFCFCVRQTARCSQMKATCLWTRHGFLHVFPSTQHNFSTCNESFHQRQHVAYSNNPPGSKTLQTVLLDTSIAFLKVPWGFQGDEFEISERLSLGTLVYVMVCCMHFCYPQIRDIPRCYHQASC